MSHDPFMDEVPDPPMHYDRLGVPISLREWAHLMDDPSYCILCKTTVGDFEVSTIWIGIDYSFGIALPGDPPGLPIIFETVIFGAEHVDLSMHRYATEGAARLGHEQAVQMVMAVEDTDTRVDW